MNHSHKSVKAGFSSPIFENLSQNYCMFKNIKFDFIKLC